MVIKALPKDLRDLYEIREWNHATAVLEKDFPDEWRDIIAVLRDFTLKRSEIVTPGGRKSDIAGSIDGAFAGRGWVEKGFDIKIVVDENDMSAPTHKIDCFKNGVGLEIEWNNKDPFFDRDLNNFRLLFELRAIHVGVIITRCDELQELFRELGLKDKYGASTTHMSKLVPRLDGGGAGGCPVLVFGISRRLYREGE